MTVRIKLNVNFMRTCSYIILLLLLPFQFLSGQCLDRDSLSACISRLEQDKTAPVSDELNALLRYDEQMKPCPGKNDSVYTYLQMRIAIMYYLQTDFMQAIQYLNKGISVAKASEHSRLFSKEYLIRSYYYLSVCYDSLKMTAQQNEAIDSAIACEMKYNADYHYSCFLLYNSVNELSLRGDFNLCIDHSSLGESITRQWYRFSDRMEYILYFIENKVKSLWSLGRYTEAETFLNGKKDMFLKSGDKSFIARIYRLFGYINKENGEGRAAIDYFLKAWTYDQSTKEKQVSAEVLTQIGLIYSEKFQNPRQALSYYHKALKTSKTVNAFSIYGYIANSYVQLKKFDSAYSFFQKAFYKIKPGLSDRDLVSNAADLLEKSDAEHVLRLVLDNADAYLKQYQYEQKATCLREALRIYKLTDQLLNYIKGGQFSVESKLYWRSYASRLYNHAIESAYLSGDNTNAFYFFEKSRAVLLNDQVNEQNLLSKDELLKLAHLKSKILITGRMLHHIDTASKQFEDLEHALFIYKQELVRLQENIRNQKPLYYQSSFDTVSIGIAEVQNKLLNGRGSFVELYAGDSSLYTLMITATDIHFLKTGRQAFDSSRYIFNSLINNPGLLNSRYPLFINMAGSLFKTIFQNVSIPAGKIIFSPDGNYFPFEALVVSKSGEPVHYLISDHAVSYTYSARFLFTDFYSNSSSPGKSFMGIAPVNYPSGLSLASLAGSDHSLMNISGHFDDAVTMTSSAATRKSFLRQFYQYNVIQLYTHAADSSTNNEPVIYFADSALYLSDLIGENKTLTKLIVLSACETGSGKEYRGEGVFSFNRAFAALGIPSSVTNLWSVDNESTYKLTELFYTYVAKGFPLDEALQQAKLEFISKSTGEKQLPYYWAATVLVGNTSAIAITKSTNWSYYYAAVITVPILLFIFIIVKRRKRFLPVRGIAEIPS